MIGVPDFECFQNIKKIYSSKYRIVSKLQAFQITEHVMHPQPVLRNFYDLGNSKVNFTRNSQ